MTNCPRAMVTKVQFATIQAHVAKLRREGLIRKRSLGMRFDNIHHYCAKLYLAHPRQMGVQAWPP